MAQDEVVSSASDLDSDSEPEEDDEGDLAESFDPVSFYNRSSNTPLMGSYVKFLSMVKDDPLLDHPSLKCHQADDSRHYFPTKSDNNQPFWQQLLPR